MALLRTDLAAPDEYEQVDEHGGGGRDERDAVPVAARLRVLAAAALGPLITGYAAVAALFALVTAIAAGARFTTVGVLAAAAPGWLAAHQVPVSIGGRELGALPLLPTIAVLGLVVRTACGAAQRLDLRTPREAIPAVGTIVGGHLVLGLVLALWGSDGAVTADPLAAAGYPALLAGLAAILGVARHCGLLALLMRRAGEVALRGMRVGLLAVAALLTAGAALVVLGLLTSIPAIRESFAHNASGPGGDVGGGVGMLLLSVGYLPNAIIAGTSFVAGPGFSMGSISVAPLDFTAVRVPDLQLLAALPESRGVWWPVLFAVPVGIGVVVGRLLRDVSDEPVARLRAVAVATGVVAVTVTVLAAGAGGALGGGPLDPLDLHAAPLFLALVAWIGLTGAVVAWFGGTRLEPDGPAVPLDDRGDGEDDGGDGDVDEEEDGVEEPECEPDNADLTTEIDSPPPTLSVSPTDPPGEHAEPQ
jgi:hypothetical protein